ncbi:ABC transporter B family member 9-like protein, partial [Trifolium pratense]
MAQTTEEKYDEKVPFYKLFSFADKLDVTLMIIGVICAVANGLSRPLMALIFGKLINTFGSTGPSNIVHEVSKVALLFVYLGIGCGIALFLQVTCWMVTGERQATRIRGLYLKTILKQEISYFDTEATSGEVIGRMSENTILIQDAISEKVGKFIQIISYFLGGYVIAFTKGWELSLVLLACVPCFIIIGGFMSMMMARMSIRGQIAYSEAGAVVEQTVGAIRTVASFTGEEKAIEKYHKKLKIAYYSTVQQGLASGTGMGLLLLIVIGTNALAMWYGSKLIIAKGYNGGHVFNIIISINTGGILMSLGQATPILNAFTTGKVAAYKMFETIKRKPKIDAYDTSGTVLENIKGDIELKDVYFRYPTRPDVHIFSGFSFYIPSGTTAAFVGQSGSGKSTIINLLERFYDPEAGEVLIDDVNLKNFQVRWIREQIGLVCQEPVLFTASIKENIAYGKEGASDEEITTAITLANAKIFIDQLPQGLDTMVGHGTQLSGGQIQRIAIARAILKNPRILLLDEATSALDAESESVVQEALEKVMSQKTTVVVAHRLITIRNADIIAVVHQGKIVEKGIHDELIKDPFGAYSQLISLQEGSEEAKESHNSETDESKNSFNLDSHVTRTSFAKSISQGSSRTNDDVESSELDNVKGQKVSIKRLAKLNKPEVPVLLLGSIAAAVHGVIFPMAALFLSLAVNTFYEPPEKLRKDSEFWSLLSLGLGFITLVAIPVQNYLFGIAGGKLIERIRSLTFNKVVHQEISWFDHPSNSSVSACSQPHLSDLDRAIHMWLTTCSHTVTGEAVCARLATDASTVRNLVGDTLALMVQNIATVTAGLVLAFTANWILSFVVLSVSSLLLIHEYIKTKFLKGFSAEAK